jgi:hypothetical protein
MFNIAAMTIPSKNPREANMNIQLKNGKKIPFSHIDRTLDMGRKMRVRRALHSHNQQNWLVDNKTSINSLRGELLLNSNEVRLVGVAEVGRSTIQVGFVMYAIPDNYMVLPGRDAPSNCKY